MPERPPKRRARELKRAKHATLQDLENYGKSMASDKAAPEDFSLRSAKPSENFPQQKFLGPTEMRRFANAVSREMHEEIILRKAHSPEVEKLRREVDRTHANLVEALRDYQKTKDPAERARFRREAESHFKRMRGELREAVMSAVAPRPREPKSDKSIDALHAALKRNVAEEEFKVLRARIKELERKLEEAQRGGSPQASGTNEPPVPIMGETDNPEPTDPMPHERPPKDAVTPAEAPKYDDTLEIMHRGEMSVMNSEGPLPIDEAKEQAKAARTKLKEMLAKYGQQSLEGENTHGADVEVPFTEEEVFGSKTETANAQKKDSVAELKDMLAQHGQAGLEPEKVPPGTDIEVPFTEEEVFGPSKAAEATKEESKPAPKERKRNRVDVSKERGALRLAEDEFRAEESEFYKDNSKLGRFIKRKTGRGMGKLNRLEGDMNTAAANYEQKLEERLAQGIGDAMTRRGEKSKLSDEEYAQRFAEKYRRMYASKDVIDRGEKLRAESRQSAIELKGVTALEKAWEWVAKKNSWLEQKLGKNGARVARVMLSAGAATGLVMAFGPATAAVAPVFGYRALRGLFSAFGGGAVGAGAGKVYEKTFGAAAANRLAEMRLNAAETPEDIAAKRAAYRAGNEDVIARKRKVVEMGTAAAVGGATALGLSEAGIGQIAMGGAHPEYVGPAPKDAFGSMPPNYSTAGEYVGPVPQDSMGYQPEAPIEVKPVIYSDIEVGKGHGYEWMLKRMYEDLKPQYLKPEDFPEGSDIRALLTANDGTIDKVVHQMAMNDQHQFFHTADGRSVLIEPGTHMTIGEDGNIHVSGPHMNDTVHAPEGAKTTPPYHPEAPGKPEGASAAALEAHAAESVTPLTDESGFNQSPEYYASQPVAPGPRYSFPEGGPMTVNPEAGGTVTPLPTQEVGTIPPPHPVIENAAIPAEAPALPIDHPMPFTNHLNVPVDPTHGHVFAVKGGAYAYGNNFAERFNAAQEYVQKNHDATVWVQAEKPKFIDGAWRPWVMEVKYGGFFRGVNILNADGPVNGTQVGAVDPETFEKQLS